VDRATELELIDELLALKASRSAFLDTSVASSPIGRYVDEAHFVRETAGVLRPLPEAAAHAGELAGPGDFLRRDVRGLPVLLTRDRDGRAHAFLNVCRHRGARLVDEASGCRHRFTCPYHGWTYAGSGELLGAPHFDAGFTGLDRGGIALTPLPLHEAHGLLWVVAEPGGSFDFAAFFGPLDAELDALGLAGMRIAAEDREERAANWKLLVEGGIESYHFRVAHRATIGPHFEDNLSSYRALGPHLRSVLPRTGLERLHDAPRAAWRLRELANLVYTLFPTTQLLVQQDHVVWITQTPLSAGRTALRLATLVPNAGPLAEGRDDAHWQRNHRITMTTLAEDFAIGEGIQAGLASGANAALTFGRFEGALARFNASVDARLDAADGGANKKGLADAKPFVR